ncbi:MAG: rhodanese-like domain-containing protein [Pseudomonadota bacterium]
MKSAKEYLKEANAAVPRMTAEEAIEKYNAGGGVFVDVRDSGDIAKSGTIKGAVRIPRGFLEFAADPETQAHNPALQKSAEIYLVCAAGGQAALAGKTLKEMGYENVTNIGGVGDWKKAGGPVED